MESITRCRFTGLVALLCCWSHGHVAVMASKDGAACWGDVASISHMRPMEQPVAAAVREGLLRSATLREIVTRLESLPGLVFLSDGVVWRSGHGKYFTGAMSHRVVKVGDLRIIRITVQTGRGNATIATIAHELWHAVEVLRASEAIDLPTTNALFQRIGYYTEAGAFETVAALNAEQRTVTDLRRCKPKSREGQPMAAIQP